MKLRIFLSAIAVFCLSFAVKAQQDVKIGYTNVEVLMSLMPEMQQIDADMKDYGTQLRTNVDTKSQNFQREAQSYQQAAATMTEEARAAKEQELMKMRDEVAKYEQDAQVSYQRKLSELLEPVQTKVFNAINAVAAEHNYTHIFSETAGQSPVLLYTKEADKFTELVAAKLGIELPEQMPEDANLPQ